MIQYLVILLDDTSVSFCHYSNGHKERRLMPANTLKAGILYGMKENLNIQFVYPNYDLPEEYDKIIESVDHSKIKPESHQDSADVVVIDGMEEAVRTDVRSGTAYVLRTDKTGLFGGHDIIVKLLQHAGRLNITLTDVETFTNDDFDKYKDMLKQLAADVEKMYAKGHSPQLNILTDRMMLDKMCGRHDNNTCARR